MSKNLKSDVDFVLEIPEPNVITGGSLNTNQLTYAKLASSAYEKSNSPDDIDGYICDRSYGQANSSVYYNQDLKEVVLAIRGTNKSNPEDLVNDANILVGNITRTKRFVELSQRLGQIIKQYVGYRVLVCGHSLGGRLAQELLLKYPNYIDSAHIFNSGSSFDVAIKGLYLRLKKSTEYKIMRQKLHIYSVPGDPLSFLSRFLPNKSITTEISTSVNPIDQHTMTNFTGSGIIKILNLKDLRLIAKEKGLKGYHNLKKSELIKMLS